MKRMTKKREEISKWSQPVGPKIFKFMEKIKLETSICQPHYLGNKVYQVDCFRDDKYVVDLENKTCACRRWQLIRLPCVHAMSMLLSQHENPLDFVDDCYKREAYLKAYNPVIYALNGLNMWPKTNQLPIQGP